MLDKGVIVCGAIGSGLPAEYTERLKAIPHNGYKGDYGLDVQEIWLSHGWGDQCE